MKIILHKTDFIKNTLTLMTGTALAQVVPIVISPILTRLYSPEEYGTLALFTAIVGICSVVATLRYELAIMLPDNDGDSVRIVILSIGIAFLLSVLLAVIILLFSRNIAYLLKDNQINNWLYYLPLMVFLIGIFQSMHYWISRIKQYRRLSIAQFTRSSSKAGMQIGIYYIFPSSSSTGLIRGSIVGQSIATFFIIVLSIKSLVMVIKQKRIIDFDRFRFILQKYKNFPLINSPHALINTLSANLPVILLTRYFTSEVAGFYSLALMVVMLPSGLVSNAIGQVFFQKISEIFNKNENLYPYVLRLSKTLLITALLPFLFLFITAPYLFSLVFGLEWGIAGIYTRIMIPWIFVRFIAAPISYVPLVLGFQSKAFFLEIISICLVALALIIGGLLNSVLTSLILLSLLSLLVLVYSFFWVLSISKRDSSKI